VASATFAALFVAATSNAQQEPDGFRFHGYLRSGFGVADDGKPQEAFKAPNTLAKYRLGNETEAYLETTFAYGVRPEDDPKTFFDTRITVSYVTPTSNTNFETTTALRRLLSSPGRLASPGARPSGPASASTTATTCMMDFGTATSRASAAGSGA
jgi:maltoporin